MVASALVFSAWSLPISSAAHNVSDTSSFCGSIIVRSGKACKHRVKALPAARMDNAEEKVIWIWTRSKEVLTTAVERGWDTFVFSEEDKHLAYDWASIATFRSLFISDGIVIDHENKQIGLIAEVSSSRELQDISRMAGHTDNIIVSCLDWQSNQGAIVWSDGNILVSQMIIPAENLVAVFQGSGTSTFAVAKTLYDAQVFLEALEKGVDGVVVHTDDTQLIFELKAFLNRKSQSSNVIKLSVATITQVKVLGLGDRVCVDLCSLLYPGEGLLVGSFSRGLFLVHSECLESSYIATRPFRVNAGPVHAYVAIPDGKTSYLAELKSGQEVIVVDSSGRQRRVSVGRVKIESRPLILVKAKIESSEMEECSIILQNAETVSLVCHSQERQAKQLAIPVSTLKVGDKVLLSLQASARHTGLPIQEFIVER